MNQMTRLETTLRALRLVLPMLVLIQFERARAQEDEDLLLLTSQFGELCTMCEAYLRCKPTHQSLRVKSEEGAFTIYYFKTKDFWGQIATIWDWFVHLIDPVQSQTRPMTVYEAAADKAAGGRRTQLVTTAFLSLEEAKIEVPDAWIDRTDGAWYAVDGMLIGQCTRVPITDAIDLVRGLGPWNDISSDTAETF